MKHSPLDISNKIAEMVQLINFALSPSNSESPKLESSWDEINNIYEEIGKQSFDEITPIFDLHVKTISDVMNFELNKIHGTIGLLGSKPFFFSMDILPTAQTYVGMSLHDFKIHINYGLLFLISELSILYSAVLFKKATMIELEKRISNLRFIISKSRTYDFNNRLEQAKRPRAVDGAIFRTIDAPPLFNQLHFHNPEIWNDKEIEFMKDIKHAMLSFILGHEFSHIIINTEKAYGFDYNEVQKSAVNYINENGLEINECWIDEFSCDANALQLSSNYSGNDAGIINIINAVAPEQLKKGNNMLRHIPYWIGAKIFFSGIRLLTGDRSLNSHPKPTSRISFLEYHMKKHSYPESIINIGSFIHKLKY